MSKQRNTGAWLPGDPVGHRQFFTSTKPVAGLSQFTIAYETHGQLNADRSNAILVCHAFTGDSHVLGDANEAHPTRGWWNGVVGPGEAIDTDRYFVVASNVLGGCQGSTGPSSIDPRTGKPYGSNFPQVSISDMVVAQGELQKHLGIDQWLCVAGGSMGGFQALDWATHFPRRTQSVVLLSSGFAVTDHQLRVQREGQEFITRDAGFQDGNYYDTEQGPNEGLGTARVHDMWHYRTSTFFRSRFADDQLRSYMEHHRDRITSRFDANTYLTLSRAMDNYYVDMQFGNERAAFSRIQANALVVGNAQDTLYPLELQVELAKALRAHGSGWVDFETVDSIKGHDAFLAEPEQVSELLGPFLHRQLELGATDKSIGVAALER